MDDLIIFIIELISKAFNGPKPPRAPMNRDPNDTVRQIQERIEAARLQNPPDPQSGQPKLVRAGPQRPASRLAQIPRIGSPRYAGTKQRKTSRKSPPAFPPVAKILPTAQPAITPSPPPPSPKPAVANVDAKLLARWLRPQTLRTQFILTEIFQPPLALRESHLS